MIGRMIRYFLPRRGPRSKLPLLSRDFSSEVGEAAPPTKAELMKMAAVAKTNQDPQRVLLRYPDHRNVAQVIRAETRNRRRRNWFRLWAKRLKDMW